MIIEKKVELLKREESFIVKLLMITSSLVFLTIFLMLPLVTVFQQSFEEGIRFYISAITDPSALSALKLSLIATIFALIINLIFGLSIAWLVSKFSFKGKEILITLLDLPFTISPVISGMMFVLLLGANTAVGKFFHEMNIQLIFAIPGIVIATTFVTFPYIARELIPQMKELGNDEEEAALLMGASGWKIFFSITIPNIKWSLFFGVIICTARAIGEFGAVSVVSGHIRGLTNTIPLHIEILYNEYNYTAAFAVASMLTMFAVITLIVKKIIEYRYHKKMDTK